MTNNVKRNNEDGAAHGASPGMTGTRQHGMFPAETTRDRVDGLFVVNRIRTTTGLLILCTLLSCGGSGETVTVESSQPHLTQDKDEFNRLLGLHQPRDTTAAIRKPFNNVVAKRTNDVPMAVSEKDSLIRLIDELSEELIDARRIAEQQAILIDSLIGELAAGSTKPTKTVVKNEEPKKEIVQPKKIVVTSAAKTSADPVRTKFDNALSVMKKKRYKTASSAFEKILAEHPDHELAGAAQFQLADCYFMMLDYSQALVDFQKALTFAGAAADAIQLKIGLCYYRMQNGNRARESFEKLVAQFPKSPHVKTAKEYLAKL